jgi:hypothetical protein
LQVLSFCKNIKAFAKNFLNLQIYFTKNCAGPNQFYFVTRIIKFQAIFAFIFPRATPAPQRKPKARKAKKNAPRRKQRAPHTNVN